jgi:hypothetical protein
MIETYEASKKAANDNKVETYLKDYRNKLEETSRIAHPKGFLDLRVRRYDETLNPIPLAKITRYSQLLCVHA